jgi:hypothetical protein
MAPRGDLVRSVNWARLGFEERGERDHDTGNIQSPIVFEQVPKVADNCLPYSETQPVFHIFPQGMSLNSPSSTYCTQDTTDFCLFW